MDEQTMAAIRHRAAEAQAQARATCATLQPAGDVQAASDWVERRIELEHLVALAAQEIESRPTAIERFAVVHGHA
jgi:hypothetical protein